MKAFRNFLCRINGQYSENGAVININDNWNEFWTSICNYIPYNGQWSVINKPWLTIDKMLVVYSIIDECPSINLC